MNFLIKVNVCELNLLQGLSVCTKQRCLQRKASLEVEPDTVTEAEGIVRPDSQQNCFSACDTFFANNGDIVFATETNIVRWQRRKQRTLIVPFFEQYSFLVGQNALHFIAVANDLEAITFLDNDSFTNDAIGHHVYHL